MTSVRTFSITALMAACAVTALAEDKKPAPAPSPPTPAVQRMNQEAQANQQGNPQANQQTPSGRQAPAPSPPTPAVRRMNEQTPDAANTPGWSQMTPQERESHRRAMQDSRSGADCRAAVARQREQLAQRARERGQAPPNNPGVDPCAGR